MYMKTNLRVCLVIACALFLNKLPAQINFFPDELVVTASVLNLRDKPDKTGKVVEKLPRGAELSLLSLVNDGEYIMVDSTYGAWLRVQHKNKSGYVFSPFVSSRYTLYQDGDILEEMTPGLNWYGVYMRDSFTDDLRSIQVHLEKEYHEVIGEEVMVLKTNQKEHSKFLVATVSPLAQGVVSNLGLFDPGSLYITADLSPGVMMPIYPGQDMDDTTSFSTFFLAATGCAQFDTNDYVYVSDYRLYAFETMQGGPTSRQDITGWVQPAEGINPRVQLVWFGDLDRDRKPDAILQDYPNEAGGRMSLFLSSKAKTGAFLHKVSEYYFQID